MTLPYLTTENFRSDLPLMLLAAINNLSEQSFEAPYKFIGEQALSVLNATIFLTFVSKHACTRFSAPITFVLINSMGLYSAAGTCFKGFRYF